MLVLDIKNPKEYTQVGTHPQLETIAVDFMIPTHIVVANQLAPNSQFEKMIENLVLCMLPEIRKFAKIKRIDDPLGRFNSEYVKYVLSLTLQK